MLFILCMYISHTIGKVICLWPAEDLRIIKSERLLKKTVVSVNLYEKLPLEFKAKTCRGCLEKMDTIFIIFSNVICYVFKCYNTLTLHMQTYLINLFHLFQDYTCGKTKNNKLKKFARVFAKTMLLSTWYRNLYTRVHT